MASNTCDRNLGLVRGEGDPVWRGFPGTSFEILSGKAGTFLSLHTGAAGALGTRTLVFLR